MPRVVLFKTPGSSSSADPYLDTLLSAGHSVQYIPVLQETFHLEALQGLLRDGDERNEWAGVVMTSKRGAEAWIKAIGACCRDLHTDWSKVQLFTVGASSLDLLDAEQNILPQRARVSTATAVQAKSATALLPLLLARPADRPYLLIRGDKSTNELQDGLTAARRAYREVVAYRTSARKDLPHELHLSMLQTEWDRNGDWMAFFSPSSAEMVLSHCTLLRNRGRIAAIGETTAAYLREAGWEVDAVAEQPTAEGLLRAIQNSEAQS